MRRPSTLFPVALVVVLAVAAGCGADEPAKPGAVPFARVNLPNGAVPLALATTSDALLVGLRRGDGPALLRRGPDGTTAEVAVHPAEPYGQQARWESLAADDGRIVAVGGKRGGAHGNVRWSAWSGSDAGIRQQAQPFSTFGGLGAGDLIDAVLTPAGPALVGTWQGQVGLDVAVWTQSGERWLRQDSTGTALANTRESLKFPMAATSVGQGVAVAGWELAKEPTGSGQRPVVLSSSYGVADWTVTRLPEPGEAAAAVSIRCWESDCAVAGRSDGELAMWERSAGTWTRVPGVPPIPVADEAPLPAPVRIDGHLTQAVVDGDEVSVLQSVEGGWRRLRVSGPSGQVTAVALVSRTLYVLAGEELWHTDVSRLTP